MTMFPEAFFAEVLQKYGVQRLSGPCRKDRSCVYILSTGSSSFLMQVGLHHGCPLSLILLVFMDRITRCSCESKGPDLGTSGSCLCFMRKIRFYYCVWAMILIQRTRRHFAAEWEVVKVGVSSSKFNIMVLMWNAPFETGGSLFLRWRSLNIFMFTSNSRNEWEMD